METKEYAKNKKAAIVDAVYATRVEPGQHEVALEWVDKVRTYNSDRFFGYFRIVGGEHAGKYLLRVWNGQKKVLARSSNLSLDYMNVTGRRPPSTGLTPTKFLKGIVVLAEVAWVKESGHRRNRIELPEPLWYSKIDRIIGSATQGPPA